MLPAEAWEEGWQRRPEACLCLRGPSSVRGSLGPGLRGLWEEVLARQQST